jgi:hypothetical protein
MMWSRESKMYLNMPGLGPIFLSVSVI